MQKLTVTALMILLLAGCAKRIPVAYDEVEKDALVNLKTVSGQSVTGIVKSKQPTMLIVQYDRNKSSLQKINRNEIVDITAKPFTRDYQNKVISEWEIEDNQGSRNTWLYTIGGIGLSFGASFFIGSLLHRSMSESDSRDAALWGTTAAGTALGTYMFTKAGKNKDRNVAIAEIRENRYQVAKKEMELEKRKHERIQKELQGMKAARDKQNSEIERLKNRLKKRENLNKPDNTQ